MQPKAGEGQEIYIFPSVQAAPSYATDEHGLEAGEPEADESNIRKDVIVSLMGEVTEPDDANDLPIIVESAEVGNLPQSTRIKLERGDSANRILMSFSTALLDYPSDDDIVDISDMTGGSAYVASDSISMLKDPNSDDFYAFLLGTDLKLRVLKQLPGIDTAWTLQTGGTTNVSTALSLTLDTRRMSIAAYVYQESMYVVVSGGKRTEGYSEVAVYHFNPDPIDPTSNKFTQIGDIYKGLIDSQIDGGMSLVEAGEYIVGAYGTRNLSSKTSIDRFPADYRTVSLIRHSNPGDWSDDGMYARMTQLHYYQKGVEAEFNDLAVHPTSPNYQLACTSSGDIYETSDSGASWAKLENIPTSGKIKLTKICIPKCTTVEPSEDDSTTFPFWAGGEKGTILYRSNAGLCKVMASSSSELKKDVWYDNTVGRGIAKTVTAMDFWMESEGLIALGEKVLIINEPGQVQKCCKGNSIHNVDCSSEVTAITFLQRDEAMVCRKSVRTSPFKMRRNIRKVFMSEAPTTEVKKEDSQTLRRVMLWVNFFGGSQTAGAAEIGKNDNEVGERVYIYLLQEPATAKAGDIVQAFSYMDAAQIDNNDIQYQSGSIYCYLLGKDSELLRWARAANTGVGTLTATTGIPTSDKFSSFWVDISNTTAGPKFTIALEKSGKLLKSHDGTSDGPGTWVYETGFKGVAKKIWHAEPYNNRILTYYIPSNTEARPEFDFNLSSNLITQESTFNLSSFDQRAFPSLLKTPGGVYLACTNLYSGKIEIYFSSDNGDTFSGLSLIPFTNEFGFSTANLVPDVLGWFSSIDLNSENDPVRPSLLQFADGSLLVIAKERSSISMDGGNTWLLDSDPALGNAGPTISLNADDASNNITTKELYQCCTYAIDPIGRIVTLVKNWNSGDSRSDVIKAKVGYNWTDVGLASDQVSCLVKSGVEQFIGVGTLRIRADGVPGVGDQWTINPVYQYSKENILVESPSQYWRSTDDSSNQKIYWDRTDADTQTAMGDGDRWVVDSFSLFGTNFRQAYIGLSVPDFNDDIADDNTYEINEANFTRFLLDATVDEAVILATRFSTSFIGNILVTGKKWDIDQFAPGLRQYYAEIVKYDASGAIVANSQGVYKILGNTEDTLIIEKKATTTSPNQYPESGDLVDGTSQVFIFGDRMWSDGSNGMRDGSDSTNPLRNTPYQFGKVLFLDIPVQPTAEGYFKVGTAILGRQVPPVLSDKERGRFSSGWSWKAMPSTVEKAAISGVEVIEHTGKAVQEWLLSYEMLESWDRDSTMNPLFAKMKRAFAVVLDSESPLSLEIGRLKDIPQFTNPGGDFWSFQVSIKEVI